MIKGNHGFSLVSVMIAIGISGMLAVGMMKLTETQTKNTKRSESRSEIMMMTSTVNQYLVDADSCLQTLDPNQVLENGNFLNSIKTKTGKDIYIVNKKYGSVKILSIEVVGDITNGVTSDISLHVIFKEDSKILQYREFTKKFLIKVTTDALGKPTECYGDTEGTIDAAKLSICNDFQATWDNASKKCDISTSPLVKKAGCVALGGSFDTASGKCSRVQITGEITGSNILSTNQATLTDQGATLTAQAATLTAQDARIAALENMPPPAGSMTVVTGTNPTCPAGTTTLTKLWKALSVTGAKLGKTRSVTVSVCSTTGGYAGSPRACTYCKTSRKGSSCRVCRYSCTSNVTLKENQWTHVQCQY